MMLDCQYPSPFPMPSTSHPDVLSLSSYMCVSLDILDIAGIHLVDDWSIDCGSNDWSGLAAIFVSKTASTASCSAGSRWRSPRASSVVHQICLHYHFSPGLDHFGRLVKDIKLTVDGCCHEVREDLAQRILDP
jgi:hypothetical protein